MLEGANPFEFLVEALSTNSRHHDMYLVDSFQRSEFFSSLLDVVDEGERLQDSRRQFPRRITLRYPFWKQVIVLSKRGFRHIARDPSLLFTYNLVTMLVAFLSGCIFYQLTDDFAGVQNRVSAIENLSFIPQTVTILSECTVWIPLLHDPLPLSS